MTGRLDGKIAIVTGAASGIGRGSALAFAREGATVLCTDIDPAVKETAEEAGGSSITGELSDPAAAEAVTRAALDLYGRIDVVYACAGIAGAGTAADTDIETWNRVIAVNLTSKWLSFKYALPGMVSQGSGSVIVQASIGGLRGVPGIFPYAAAKAGCIGMARQAAIDYGPHGVRVNVIAPGNVPTPLVRKTYEAGGGMGAGLDIDEAMARIGDVYPMRRVGTVEEVAAMAVHLAGDESSWTTGQVFVVDGGITSAQPGRRT